MRGVRPSRFHLPLVLMTLALGMSLAACGGDESSSDAAAERREAEARAEAALEARNAEVAREYRERRAVERPSEEELKAKGAAAAFYEILAREKGGANRATIDSEAFCDLMSEQAAAETARYVRVSSGLQQEWDCESAVDFLVIRAKRAGSFGDVRNATVIGVNARGERASASVRFGDGTVAAVALVREGGEWKLAASGLGR